MTSRRGGLLRRLGQLLGRRRAPPGTAAQNPDPAERLEAARRRLKETIPAPEETPPPPRAPANARRRRQAGGVD